MNDGEMPNHASVQIDARGIATLTIVNSGPLNILSTPVINDLTRALQTLSQDAAVRVLILQGTGESSFIAGADIREMATLTREDGERFISDLRTLFDSLRQLPVAVIARLPGWCLGGGLECALACDIRIAADTAKFGMPEVKVGMPSVIHAALMPRLIGNARAAWMLLTGETITAAEALSYGLVSKVVSLAALDDEVARVARLLAGYGPSALRQQKRLLREWEDQPLDTSICDSITEFGFALDTGEPQRYMSAFLNRKS